MADVNAGEGFLARLTGIWIPSLVSGSGKLETPWSRMQVANLSPSAWLLDVAAGGSAGRAAAGDHHGRQDGDHDQERAHARDANRAHGAGLYAGGGDSAVTL